MKCLQHTRMARVGVFALSMMVIAAPNVLSAPKIIVSSNGIEDRRDTTEGASYMEVSIKAQGSLTKRSPALRATVTQAVDDAGHSVVASTGSVVFGASIGKFDTIGRTERDGDSVNIKLLLQSPPRQAAMLSRVVGNLEFYLPENDPQSVITKDLSSQTGKAVASPILKAANLSVTMWTKEGYEKYKKATAAKNVDFALLDGVESMLKQAFGQPGNANSVIFHVKDPRMRLAKIDIEDAKGQAIKSSMSASINVTESDYELDFPQKLTSGARIKLYVATPKSIVKVPFELKDLPLP